VAKNWENAANILWPELVKAAKNKKSLYYYELAPIINTNPLSVGRALDPIQNYCLDAKLPPLTAIVVNTLTNKPGNGFIAWDIDNLEAAFSAVFNFDWQQIQNPFSAFGPNDTTITLAKELIENPNSSNQIYNKINNRGVAQVVFRNALLIAYNYSCAICSLSYSEALEAAHIIPWSKSNESQKISPQNGILLCANHHKIFDRDILTINEDYIVSYNNNATFSHNYTAADKALTVDIHNQKIHLPRKIKLLPNPEWIKIRNTKSS
jgi:putative restriction endonuclease